MKLISLARWVFLSLGDRDENLRASRFDAVFQERMFRPENTKKAKQSCRPDHGLLAIW